MASTLHTATNNVAKDNIQPALNTSQQQILTKKEQMEQQQQQRSTYDNDNTTIHFENADNNSNIKVAAHNYDVDRNTTTLDTATSLSTTQLAMQQLNAHQPQQFAINDSNLPHSPPPAQSGLGGITTLMQTSPPPHSYRHSRAYRHFKNPPQPHMCIRTTTESGDEIFINVLSWTRIVIPQEPSDPIPLYGGMRVPPGSPRSPPIVFAVMANPEVLKDSGRHSKDAEERRAMVELMCDFVEAMNPGIKLIRNAVILKDRDISGELKDVWNAVQAQRDREREEQILQQRQQQHYHNITTQQMFPKTNEQHQQQQQLQQQANSATTSPQRPTTSEEDAEMATAQKTLSNDSNLMEQIHENGSSAFNEMSIGQEGNQMTDEQTIDLERTEAANALETVWNTTQSNDGSMEATIGSNHQQQQQQKDSISPTAGNDQIDANISITNGSNGEQHNNDNKMKTNGLQHVGELTKIKNSTNASQTTTPTPVPTVTATTTTSNSTAALPTSPVNSSAPAVASISQATPAPVPSPAPIKKEKLGGFLPNGCIFPRFKNNKHKDKDKDKDKDKEKEKETTTKTKDKEKTLLNALKKNKDKKIVPILTNNEQTTAANNQLAADTANDTKNSNINYEKNCMNLECEVQKLDLNKMDINSTTNNDNNMFIKLKVTAATNTSTATAK